MKTPSGFRKNLALAITLFGCLASKTHAMEGMSENEPKKRQPLNQATTISGNYLAALPKELITHTLNFLPAQNLFRLFLTNKNQQFSPQLKVLDLSNTCLSEEKAFLPLFSRIHHMTILQDLRMRGTLQSANLESYHLQSLVKALAPLTRLETLDLRENKIELSKLPKDLGLYLSGLTNLKTLLFSGNEQTPEGQISLSKAISQWTKLETLELQQVGSPALMYFQHSPNTGPGLTQIFGPSTYSLSTPLLQSLTSLKALKNLVLWGNNLELSILSKVFKLLPQLKHLNISNIFNKKKDTITKEEADVLFSSFPLGLETLKLSNTLLEDKLSALTKHLSNFTNLRTLDLSYTGMLTTGLTDLESSLPFLTQLEELYLRRNTEIAPESLSSFISHLGKLSHLSVLVLPECALTKKGVKALNSILPSLKNLKTINFQWNMSEMPLPSSFEYDDENSKISEITELFLTINTMEKLQTIANRNIINTETMYLLFPFLKERNYKFGWGS